VKFSRIFSALALTAFAISGTACGHSDEEMESKTREIEKLNAELRASKTQLTQDQAKFNESNAELERLRDQLKNTGMGLEKSKDDAARMRVALTEFKARADQLAVIEGRFKELRAKLEKLNAIGLKVVVRNNRMVIQLPGDVLFDSGKDALKPQGRDALIQVAEVIRSDKDLNARHFLVAGHTDNVKYGGGPFNDNWGLSLARARQVLLFLVAPDALDKDKKAQGGGLQSKNWGASGYGDTDPFAGTIETQTKDEMNKNRRVELVVQPNVEEMLNLGAIK
jgi:chemotaxis protein MotB